MKYGERISGPARLRLAIPKALPESMRGPVVELRSLYTAPAHRRKGHAARLLDEVTAEADAAGFFLFLAVEPSGDMDAQALLSFYCRYGFVPIQADPILMVRPVLGVRKGKIDVRS